MARFLIRTFDLLLFGILLVFQEVIFLTLSYNYFIENKYFEGFMVIGSMIVPFLCALPLLIIVMIRSFENFKMLLSLTAMTVIISFIGFRIPLIIIPILTAWGIYYVYRQCRLRLNDHKG